jgi:hypothetical protein
MPVLQLLCQRQGQLPFLQFSPRAVLHCMLKPCFQHFLVIHALHVDQAIKVSTSYL